jgi:hypothetical protein
MIDNIPQKSKISLENNLNYNGLCFYSKIHNEKEIITLLGLDKIPLDIWESTYAFYGYSKRINFQGINVMFGGKNEGVSVEMSDQGCRAYETFGNGNYDEIFALIRQNFDNDSKKRKMRLARLDVAYDDFNKILNIDEFAKNSMDKQFGVGINYTTRFVSSPKKKAVVVILNEGLSLEFGSKKSDVFFRMYDKRVERHAADIEHWIRFEIQLRNNKAMGFINDPADIREKYFMVINEFIEYKKPSKTDTNKSRWQTAPFWKKFIETGGKIARFNKPGMEYNRDRLKKYVYEMAGGAVTAEALIVGTDKFCKELFETRAGKNKKLNPKYQQIIDTEKLKPEDVFNPDELTEWKNE